MGTSYSVAALLGSEITGSDTLGAIAAVGLSIGQSFAGIPVAVLMAKRGRRIGIGTAYLVGAMGATCALFAALTETYLLLVVGMTLCGCGQAGNLAARYAGSDLATDRDRGRSISLVVWGNTVGSVLGPTVGLGLRSLAGTSEGGSGFIFSYMVSITLFIVASGVILRRLRPDPLLLVANASDTAIRGPRFSDLGLIFSHPAARIALLGMMLSQGVMVGVMTVTPLHMRDGNQEPLIIGLMISLHIVGMYAFSPWI